MAEESRLVSTAALQAMKESSLSSGGNVGRHVLGQQDVESDATVGGTSVCLSVCMSVYSGVVVIVKL